MSGITHPAVSGLTTGTPPAGTVGGPDWNSQHVNVPFGMLLFSAGGNTAVALTASAAAGTEIFPTSKVARALVDLSACTQMRLTMMVTALGSAATAAIKLQYVAKASEAATWAGADTGVSVVVGGGTAGTIHDSGWVNLAAGAKADNMVLAAVVGVALGATAPSVSFAEVWFR